MWIAICQMIFSSTIYHFNLLFFKFMIHYSYLIHAHIISFPFAKIITKSKIRYIHCTWISYVCRRGICTHLAFRLIIVKNCPNRIKIFNLTFVNYIPLPKCDFSFFSDLMRVAYDIDIWANKSGTSASVIYVVNKL